MCMHTVYRFQSAGESIYRACGVDKKGERSSRRSTPTLHVTGHPTLCRAQHHARCSVVIDPTLPSQSYSSLRGQKVPFTLQHHLFSSSLVAGIDSSHLHPLFAVRQQYARCPADHSAPSPSH
eukprot:Sspe_Gene.74935::Locus_46829_Transcript_9_10_Confidence_0.211_Length_782::g.74935::m.74935